jgi:hypothetical protein
MGQFGGGRSDAEFTEELQADLDLHIAANTARGMSPDEARRKALMDFGGVAQTQEAYRRQRGLPFVECFITDVRYALRTLRKDRVFSIVAVLTLALGIGSSTAVFTITNAVLLRRAPYPESERITLVWGSDGKGADRGQVSLTDIEDVRVRNRVFAAIANFSDWTPTLSDKECPSGWPPRK